jgi:hypothetical protein
MPDLPSASVRAQQGPPALSRDLDQSPESLCTYTMRNFRINVSGAGLVTGGAWWEATVRLAGGGGFAGSEPR